MLDQNTDRMWFVIGALVVGAGIIILANNTLPSIFANVTDTYNGVINNPGDFMSPNPNLKKGTMDKDFFFGWSGSQITYHEQVATPIEGMGKAHHITTTGGTSHLKAVQNMIFSGDLDSSKPYTISIYVKNQGASVVDVHDNFKGRLKIQPGETKRFIATTTDHNGKTNLQLQLQSSDDLDLLYWHPKAEQSEYATSWVP